EAGRDPETVQSGDNNFNPVKYAKTKIDANDKTATATVLGLKPRTAVFIEGFGCTLLPEEIETIEDNSFQPKRTVLNNGLHYPYGNLKPLDTVFREINYEELNTALKDVFDRDEVSGS